MIIATDKRDDNLEVDEIISRHVRVASLYSFGIKRLAKQWTSPNYIHLFLIDEFSYVSDCYSLFFIFVTSYVCYLICSSAYLSFYRHHLISYTSSVLNSRNASFISCLFVFNYESA